MTTQLISSAQCCHEVSAVDPHSGEEVRKFLMDRVQFMPKQPRLDGAGLAKSCVLRAWIQGSISCKWKVNFASQECHLIGVTCFYFLTEKQKWIRPSPSPAAEGSDAVLDHVAQRKRGHNASLALPCVGVRTGSVTQLVSSTWTLLHMEEPRCFTSFLSFLILHFDHWCSLILIVMQSMERIDLACLVTFILCDLG